MDPTAKGTAGLRKRQQITKANRMMFLWIAGVSVIVGIAIVLAIFLVQKIWFGEKVLAQKAATVSVLDKNLSVVDELTDNVRVLNTNEALGTTRLNEADSPLQSVLDALPADANSTAFASSLQTKLLAGVPGVVIESISADPANDDASAGAAGATANPEKISFTFSVSADANNYAALRQVLERLEKSIRPITVETLSVEGQGNKVVMTVSGASYYQSAQTIQLLTKVVKP